MCGIVGFIGERDSKDILIKGLKQLEYRGYDSAGIAVLDGKNISVVKETGFVTKLEGTLKKSKNVSGNAGIAHTRWATHGKVTKNNAHPHVDETGRVAIVHNGIIENADKIKETKLSETKFKSTTDSEVLAHLISHYFYKEEKTCGDPVESIKSALSHVIGTWGLAVLFSEIPDAIFAARNGSPLVIGISDNESFLASDQSVLVPYTNRVIFLNDGEIVKIEKNNVTTFNLGKEESSVSNVQIIDQSHKVADKQDYKHFMLKEIFEQPTSIKNCINGRFDMRNGSGKLDGLCLTSNDLLKINNIELVGCGTSYFACKAGEISLRQLARVNTRSHIASEFRYSNPLMHSDSIYFALSQSGETADTLGAIKEIKLKGGNVKGIVNVVGSSIARECASGVYIHSGQEISVASTKAFSNMVSTLNLFAIMLGRVKHFGLKDGQRYLDELISIPAKVEDYLNNQGNIQQAVDCLSKAKYTIFLGRGVSAATAREGALKLMEVSYIPSLAYPAGEMKHGPLALIEKGTPVIVIAPDDSLKDKTISNLQECKARGANVILIHTEGDSVAKHGDINISVPKTFEYFSPLLTILPLQLISYYTSLALDRNIDRPRNLAKSVTVE